MLAGEPQKSLGCGSRPKTLKLKTQEGISIADEVCSLSSAWIPPAQGGLDFVLAGPLVN